MAKGKQKAQAQSGSVGAGGASGAGGAARAGRAEGNERAQLERIVYEMTVLREQANELQNQLSSLQQLLEENSATARALESLAGIEGDTLFSLGAGVYAKAKPSDKKKVFMEIGARAMAEKSVDDAVKVLGERRAEIERLAASIQNTLSAGERRLNELNAVATELSRRIKDPRA